MDTPHDRDATGLDLDGLTRRFGDIVALDDLTFTVGPGQLYGFVGANGAGKTTTMRIVMGITEPDAGQVRWGGAPVDHDARIRFGYMPEERGLYPRMPAARQLVYLAELHDVDHARADRNARAWLDRLGLGDRADDQVQALSQGNQQRVQLAAALVHEPELLILDEPFAGLDPVAVDTMSTVLVEYAHDRGVPVLFSSHQLELVESLCDAVAIIDGGRLVARGDVAELRRRGRRRDRRVCVELERPGGGPVDTPWTDGLAGVEIVSDDIDHELRRTVVRLGSATDTASRDAVLAAADAAGSVVTFAEVRPTLAELYREAVTPDDAPEAA